MVSINFQSCEQYGKVFILNSTGLRNSRNFQELPADSLLIPNGFKALTFKDNK